MNVYGFASIGPSTFNQKTGGGITYPKQGRDVFTSALAITNFALRLLSYHSPLYKVGAGLRITVGVALLGVHFGSGGEVFRFRWGGEAIATGSLQILRGALDFFHYGHAINFAGDVVGTVVNLGTHLLWDVAGSDAMDQSSPAHPDSPVLGGVMIAEITAAIGHRAYLFIR